MVWRPRCVRLLSVTHFSNKTHFSYSLPFLLEAREGEWNHGFSLKMLGCSGSQRRKKKMSEMRKRLRNLLDHMEMVFLSACVFLGPRQLPARPGRIQIPSSGLPLSKALPPKASLAPRLTEFGMQPAHGTALWIVLCCCQDDLLPPAQVKGFPPVEFLWDSFFIACIT